MITEKEFKERFGFEPKHDDLHRANCDQAGEIGHLMCGVCTNCGQPRFVCGCQFQEPQYDLFALGLEMVDNELFALPDKESPIPKILVFKPSTLMELKLGFIDPNSLVILRERWLSKEVLGWVVDMCRLHDVLYRPMQDDIVHEVTSRINCFLMKIVREGILCRHPSGYWTREIRENAARMISRW